MRNILLLLGVIVLAVLPFALQQKSSEELFSGADAQAEAAITAVRPEYKPWFSPLWKPPSGEIECLLFSLQGAIGGGLLGYCLGYLRCRAKLREEERSTVSAAPPDKFEGGTPA